MTDLVTKEEITERLIKELDPDYVECSCCYSYKTKDHFPSMVHAHTVSSIPGLSSVRNNRPICDECKSDFSLAVERRAAHEGRFETTR